MPATIRQKSGNRTITGIKFTDLMMLDILKASKWKRPFYFAATVSPDNFIGLGDYLLLHGMAYKVMPWRQKSMKDVISCDKPGGGANIF